MRLLHIT